MPVIRPIMGSAWRRLRRAVPATPQPTIFSMFFSGRHSEVVELYQHLDPQSLTDEDYHLVFASLVALGKSDEDVVKHLPSPLDVQDFDDVFKEQLQSESREIHFGLLRQPRHVHKSLLAAHMGLNSGKRFFVETGTYVGMSLYKISRLFDGLWTIEADPFLYETAVALFKARGADNVSAHLGDSRTLLRELPGEVGNNAVFFLDAHYSTGITSKRFGACPVVEEVAIIVGAFPDALIVVDDVRTMNGRKGYPTLNELLAVAPNTYSAEIFLDQLILRKADLHMR